MKRGKEIYQEWEREELIAGSPEGTIFERSEYVKAIKKSPTRANFDRFLYRHGWRSVNGNGICADGDEDNWDVVWGLAKSFEGLDIDYHFRVYGDSFSPKCYEMAPGNMMRIVREGYLDVIVNYDSKIGMLRVFAEMYDPIFYGDNVKGQPLYYFDGVLDENGKLVAPLELRIDLNQRYYE